MSDKWKTKFKLLAEEVYGVDGNFDEITFNKKNPKTKGLVGGHPVAIKLYQQYLANWPFII